MLVGVLELPGQTDAAHTLQLRDGSGRVACVVTEPHEDRQRAVFNSAWIGNAQTHTQTCTHTQAHVHTRMRFDWLTCVSGCLVCVKRVTMVTEQFLQSDFPSYTHLEQDGYITHKHYR